MSKRKHISIDDLPETYKAQVRRKLGMEADKVPLKQSDAPQAIVRRKKRTANKTEADYNLRHLGGRGMYEAVTLHLAGGSRYTPDYMTVDDCGRINLYEVKGAYRFHSHGRARTAFLECVKAFPMFGFTWATRTKDGDYKVEIFS